MNQSQRWVHSLKSCPAIPWSMIVSMLLVCALGWRWIDLIGTDAGPIGERAKEMHQVYIKAVGSAGSGLCQVSDPDVIARVWKQGWMMLNGQWDTRVVAAASTVLHAGAWALIVALMAARLRGVWSYGLLAIAGVTVLLMPGAGEFWTSAATAWSGWLLLLGILQLGMQTGGHAGGWIWWVGWLAGLSNVIGAKEGGAASLVIVMSSIGCWRETNQRPGRAWTALAANVLLIAVSVALWRVRGGTGDNFLTHAQDLLSWPHGSVCAGTLLLLPALVWLLSRKSSADRKASNDILSVLAGWTLVQPLILALSGEQGSVASWGVMGACVLINAVCVVALVSEESRRPKVGQVVFALWMLAAVFALPQVGIDRDDTRVFRENDRWREAWMAGDAEGLGRVSDMTTDRARVLLGFKEDAGLQRLLPVSLRKPLSLRGEVAPEEAAFRSEDVPTIQGEAKGLPAVGTWKRGGTTRTGEFLSDELATNYPFLRLWIAGEGAGASVRLRTKGGREIGPLQEPALQPARWVRMNFETPDEAFRVVARQTDTGGWCAIAGPVETGALSWLTTKIVHAWTWLLAGAVVTLFAALAVFLRQAKYGHGVVSNSGSAGSWGRWFPWLLLGAYAWMVGQAMSPSAGGSDSSGYLNAARLFTEHRVTMPVREAAGISAEEFGREVFMPLAFKPTARNGEIATVTAIGVPAMYAAAAWFVPLAKAVPWVIMGNALLAIVATRLVAGAFGLPRHWSWVAAGIVGLSPQFLFIGFQALSDGPSLAWVTLAVYFAWRSRERVALAWLAGVATAMAVLVRPSNVLCILPVLACLPVSWRGIFYWIGGGVPGGIFQAWYSWTVWGNPLTSGYGDVAEAFRLDYFPANLMHYMGWLPVLVTPVVVLAPGVFFLRMVHARLRLVLGVWAGVFLGFYVFFRHTHDAWWFLRFILPAFPALVVASLLVLHRMVTAGPASGWNAVRKKILLEVGVFSLLVFLLLSVWRFQVFFWLRGDRVFERAGVWLKENAPPGSTVLSVHGGGTVIYYTDLPVVMYHHDFVRESARFSEALTLGGKPVYALMFHFERPGGRPDFLGSWEEVASFNQGDARIWKWLGAEKEKPPGDPSK